MNEKTTHEEKESFSYLLERTVKKCANCGAYKGSKQWFDPCPKAPEKAPDPLDCQGEY